MTSSIMKFVVPRIPSSAPRYIPPENWKQNAVMTYIHGCSALGTHRFIIGMQKPA